MLRHYPRNKRDYLYYGFKFGFSIGCHNRSILAERVNVIPKNHFGCVSNISEARKAVFKEVNLGRVLGPFKTIPCAKFVCSPLNLVPKAGNPGKFRLIHDLSFSKGGCSVNSSIPDEEAKVVYQSFDSAVFLALKHGRKAFAGKIDFRQRIPKFSNYQD